MNEDKTRRSRSLEKSIATGKEGVVGSFVSDSLYHNTLQGAPIHGLIASSTHHGMIQMDGITHMGIMNSGGVIITLSEETSASITAQTFKVLLMLLTIATEQLPQKDNLTAEAIDRGRIIRISLSDYMKKCGIADRKNARDQLNAAIVTLYGIASIEWDEEEWIIPEGKSRKVKTKRHHRMRVIGHAVTDESDKPIKNGVAEVRLDYDMAKYLAGSYLMPYPAALLRVNTNNHPYSIPLGWKLCTLYNMNAGKATQGKTTVSTLLKAAKEIPSYAGLRDKGKWYERIASRFDRDMQELVDRGVLSSYAYYDGMGNRITVLATLSYMEFAALDVRYTMAGYPDQTPLIEAKQKRIAAAINRAARSAKKEA